MSLVLNHLSFTWPDGRTVLDTVNLELGPGRHGLVGLNGSGKSTLLRLLTGDLSPTTGSIDVTGSLTHQPQRPVRDDDVTVADVLGITERRDALLAIESGRVEPQVFDVVGDDWDVEERARAELDRVGLRRIELDRRAASLSGGELVLLALTARLLQRPE